MKKIILSLSVIFTILSCANKELQKNKEVKKEISEVKKEDPMGLFNSESISSLDILEALEIIGVQINKIEIGEFNKKHNLILFMEEFEKGVLKVSDTVYAGNNEFYEGFNEDGSPNIGFIDQMKIFTKTDNENTEIIVKTYQGTIARKPVKLKKTDDNQFFIWRNYKETHWKANKKVPLMVFASSWFDERINTHRFCGVAKLTEDTEATNELLNNSPSYIMLSYKILE